MKYRQVVAAIVLTTFGWGGVARGDDLTDEMTSNPAMMTTIRSLGVMACLGQEGAKDAAHDKAELKRNFWAFQPDVKLSDAERATQTAAFDKMWGELLAVSTGYNVDKVSFIGCDSVLSSHCMDLYFVAYTPNGPALFRFSMEFKVGDKARVMNVQAITGWETVKEAARKIEHSVNPTRVPTITYTPKPSVPETEPESPKL